MTIECMACGHTWDTADSSVKDRYLCHICGLDNSDFYDKTIPLKSLKDIVLEMAWKGSKFPVTKSSYWEIPAKYDSTCVFCGHKIYQGQMFYFFPYAKKRVVCKTCGPIHADRVN